MRYHSKLRYIFIPNNVNIIYINFHSRFADRRRSTFPHSLYIFTTIRRTPYDINFDIARSPRDQIRINFHSRFSIYHTYIFTRRHLTLFIKPQNITIFYNNVIDRKVSDSRRPTCQSMDNETRDICKIQLIGFQTFVPQCT